MVTTTQKNKRKIAVSCQLSSQRRDGEHGYRNCCDVLPFCSCIWVFLCVSFITPLYFLKCILAYYTHLVLHYHSLSNHISANLSGQVLRNLPEAFRTNSRFQVSKWVAIASQNWSLWHQGQMEGPALNWTCAHLVWSCVTLKNIQTKPREASQPTSTKSHHLQFTLKTKLHSSCTHAVLCALLLHILKTKFCWVMLMDVWAIVTCQRLPERHEIRSHQLLLKEKEEIKMHK